MKYACLVYLEESEINKLSQGQWDALNNECMAFGEERIGSVERLGGEALEPTHTATTVRVRDGRQLVTDGPYAEVKEALGGYFILDCESLDEALMWAARIPGASHGAVEVRQVHGDRLEDRARRLHARGQRAPRGVEQRRVVIDQCPARHGGSSARGGSLARRCDGNKSVRG